MTIKQNDIVEIAYTGKIKDGEIFDTTDTVVAKKNGINLPENNSGTITIVVGKGQLVAGIDEFLVGKSTGTFTVEVVPEKAFGFKEANLVQLIPTSKFTENNIRPVVGLHVNVDNSIGIIRSISGGRTIVDFNHPLANKDLVYDISVKRIVIDANEKLNAVLNMMHLERLSAITDDKTITITTKIELEDEAKIIIQKELKELVGYTNIVFTVKSD